MSHTPRTLTLSALTVRFGSKLLLNGITFELPVPGVLVLMGPGGAGKSTLLRTLSGLNEGLQHMHVSGGLVDESGEALALTPALVQQRLRAMSSTAREYVLMDYAGRSQMTREEQQVWLQERLDAYGLGDLGALLGMDFLDLSLSQKVLLTVAKALLSDPAVLCLDEPFVGMDEASHERLEELLRREGERRTLLLVTHHQATARRVATHAVLLVQGTLVDMGTAHAFFEAPTHPLTQHYLRTGGCYLPIEEEETAEDDVLSSEVTQEQALDDNAVSSVVEDEPEFELEEMSEASILAFEAALWQESSRDDKNHLTPSRAVSMTTLESESSQMLSETSVSASHQHERLMYQALITPLSPYVSAHAGPQDFCWLVPGRLAGTPQPGLIQDIDIDLAALERVQVDYLVTLTEQPLPAHRERRFVEIHFPMEDMSAPALEATDALCEHLARQLARDKCVVFHCRAGLGRTGTLLAAMLVWHGEGGEEALRRTRAQNPLWVQSEEQERFLVEFEAYLRRTSPVSQFVHPTR